MVSCPDKSDIADFTWRQFLRIRSEQPTRKGGFQTRPCFSEFFLCALCVLCGQFSDSEYSFYVTLVGNSVGLAHQLQLAPGVGVVRAKR